MGQTVGMTPAFSHPTLTRRTALQAGTVGLLGRGVEPLALFATRPDRWALVRSLTHKSNDHSLGHHIMLPGRSDPPAGFNPNAPSPTDHPSLAAVTKPHGGRVRADAEDQHAHRTRQGTGPRPGSASSG
jgi:hypothetical protein